MKRLAKVITLPLSASCLHGAGDGVALTPELIGRVGNLPITNSMVTSWVVSILIILLVRILAGKPRLVPSKGQLVVESVVDGIRGIIEPIVGRKVFFPSFWLLSALFLFILVQNWSGLLPGVGTIGHGPSVSPGEHFQVTKPLVRPGNADLNMTLALALVANLSWIYFILRYAGFKAIIKDWFGNKAEKSEVSSAIFALLGLIFLAVGVIEVISILFRPVSLTFRLFGNVFGGESLLHKMFVLVPELQWVLPVPFYFMEVLIGLVQALVFMLLVSVYIGLICNHDHGEHH